MRLARAARQGDRYDASVVGPNGKKDDDDSQGEVSNSVSTQGWLWFIIVRAGGTVNHDRTESSELGGWPYVQEGVCHYGDSM